MPLLDWLNKSDAVRTVQKVPYRLLEAAPELSLGDTNTENMLIQGDNLQALKALLPLYAGKVKCVFIDPPYNTRSAFTHYNDNLEHSLWLSLIYPRLELLRDLLVEEGHTENDLLFWLEPQVRQIGLIPSQLRGFLAKLIPNLTKSRGLPLTGLVRSKYVLARAVREQIENYRQQAADKGFQYALFEETDDLKTRFDHVFEFSPGYYPAKPPFYQGRYRFSKHFYSEIEDLKEDGEEFECAKLIDSHPKVKYWIRNLVNRDGAAFRLPLAKGWFYPDFVAELVDGKLLVVEYKGKVYATNDDSREKRAVGELWAKKSGGQCLFLMAEKKNVQGKGIFQQIDEQIG